MRMFLLVCVGLVGVVISGLLENNINHVGHYWIGFLACIGMDIVNGIMNKGETK